MFHTVSDMKEDDGYTLRKEGSLQVLPEGVRFYPEPFASEEPFFEERV